MLLVIVDYFKYHLEMIKLTCLLSVGLITPMKRTLDAGTSTAKWRYCEKDLLFSPKGTSLSRKLPENSACSILEKLM